MTTMVLGAVVGLEEERTMKRVLGALGGMVMVIGILAVPADAFRVTGRSNFAALFRDVTVCTDGMEFNIGTWDDGEEREPGYTPSAPLQEPLFITADPSQQPQSPANNFPADPPAVLAGFYQTDPIANDDPFWDDSNIFDPTSLALWVSTYTEFWTEPLAAGTELAVYLSDPTDEPLPAEIIIVVDCLLDPCAAPGAILGTEQADRLRGTPGDDILCGFGGNDTIIGGGGNDTIIAGDGNDMVDAGAGDDYVEGGNGNDELLGRFGDDELFGGNGSDLLDGNWGDDYLDGGAGGDTLLGGRGNDILIGGLGVDILRPGGGGGVDIKIQ
ncbi:MAG: calcium-binding protein [Actinomycetota bacterium]